MARRKRFRNLVRAVLCYFGLHRPAKTMPRLGGGQTYTCQDCHREWDWLVT